jgi:hypothetical protein
MIKKVEGKPFIVQRLSEEVYEQFAKKFPPPIVNNDTTPQMAGYQLGIQHVLAELRKGVVISGN